MPCRLHMTQTLCCPDPGCPVNPIWIRTCAARIWGALQTLYGSDFAQPGPRVPYRPCMAQTLHSLDLGCPVDPIWLRPCAVQTRGAL